MATPSTVYGNEPVTFELRSSPPASVELELSNQRGERVLSAVVAAPSVWRTPELPSGDFSLLIGPQRAACVVTVNRDLVRATSAVR